MKPVYWMVECGHLGILAPGWPKPTGLEKMACPACGKQTMVQAAWLPANLDTLVANRGDT